MNSGSMFLQDRDDFRALLLRELRQASRHQPWIRDSCRLAAPVFTVKKAALRLVRMTFSKIASSVDAGSRVPKRSAIQPLIGMKSSDEC